MGRVLDPVLALRDIGPGADEGQPFRQRIDVAFGSVDAVYLPRQPLGRDAALPLDELEDALAERGVLIGRNLAEIGDLADIPQQPDVRPALHPVVHLRQAPEGFQRQEVVGLTRALQFLVPRTFLQRGDQPFRMTEIELRIAPLQSADRREAVVFDRRRQVLVEGRGLARHAEGAVIGEAPGPPGDLRQLVGLQVPVPAAVELRGPGKGHMVDVQVQPHADGVRRHQVIHVAVLVERHLRVARPRAERAHHHRGTPLLPADQLGDGIDTVDREGDDGRAGRHPADLAAAGIGELGEPLARRKARLRHQAGDARLHGGGAQEQRLGEPARVQQPVGENIAPVGIGAELDLVDGQKLGAQAQRHRLHRADPVGGARRHDALLAGDQRHDGGTAQGDDLVIDLARQKAQRQADDAGAVAQHPLDGVMGLAGIGRPKDRGDGRVA